MAFELVAYDLLVSRLNEDVIFPLLKNKLGITTSSEDMLDSQITKLEDNRRIPAQLIRATIKLLQTSQNASEKVRLLNGLVYLIRMQVSDTYTKGRWSVMSPENSDFYKTLTKALNLKGTEQIPAADAAELYRLLKEFLCKQVYNDPDDPNQGYRSVLKNIEKPEEGCSLESILMYIQGYEVENDIIDITNRRAELTQEIINTAKSLRGKLTNPGALGIYGKSGQPANSTVAESGTALSLN